MKGHQWIDNFVTVEVLHGFDELFVHVVLRSLAELHVVEPNLIKKGSESGKFFFPFPFLALTPSFASWVAWLGLLYCYMETLNRAN